MRPEEQGARRVVAVVVTYRRRELLRRCVDAIAAQDRRRTSCSSWTTAGSRARCSAQSPRRPGRGGRGEPRTRRGVRQGFARRSHAGADAIWAVDDDMVPGPGCLERLVVGGPRAPTVAVPLQVKPGGVRGFPPSWNGPLFAAAVVREVGLPRGDLFFWAEDTEYVAATWRGGPPAHPGAAGRGPAPQPGRARRGQPRNWQLYYEVRNTLEYRLRIRRRTVKGVARAFGGAWASSPP